VVNLNTSANGANFVVNRHKTREDTIVPLYNIITWLHNLIFGRGRKVNGKKDCHVSLLTIMLKVPKDVGMTNQVAAYFEMSLTE